VENVDALRRGSLIVLDLADEGAAMEVAQKIAAATGRTVVVRDADMAEIQTVTALRNQVSPFSTMPREAM
jgi:hypothetical protein